MFSLGYLVHVKGHAKHNDGAQPWSRNAGQRGITGEDVIGDDPDVSGADKRGKGVPFKDLHTYSVSNRDVFISSYIFIVPGERK